MRSAVAIAACGLALLLGGRAVHAEDQQCFFQHDIQGFTPTDDEKTIYLRVGGRVVYRLDLLNQCPGLAFRDRIELKQFGNGNICGPNDLDLRLRAGGISIPCRISDLHRLTPEELAAVPKKYRP